VANVTQSAGNADLTQRALSAPRFRTFTQSTQSFRTLARILVGVLIAMLPLRAMQGDRFPEIYKRGAAKQRAMRSLQARFTETTTSSLLVKPIVAHGTVVAAAPARVRMTYTDPEPKILTMDGKTLTVSWPERHERQQISIVDIQKRIDHYFTSATVDELRSMFQITTQADASDRNLEVVDMKPKRKQIAEGLARLELWIDGRTDLMTRMRMTFPTGDQKTIALEDIVTDVPVTDDLFRDGR
jgi:outer membrane lipoprotein-sorting protein